MFDIGWSELLIVAVVAIIFIGPRELIPMLRTFGQYAGKMRRMANDFQSQFNEALREAELDQMSKGVEEMRNLASVNALKDQFEAETATSIAPPKADTPQAKKPAAAGKAGKPAKRAAPARKKPAPAPAKTGKAPAKPARRKPARPRAPARTAGAAATGKGRAQ